MIKVILEQECIAIDEQNWFPYEVIELGAHWLQPGHDREFTACTLLVIHNSLHGHDAGTDLESKFSDRASDYDALSEGQKSMIMRAYELAGI